MERFLLAALAGVAAVAYYTAPSEAALRLLIVPGALAAALFPALSASWAAGGTTGGAAHERLLGRPVRFLLLTLAPVVTAIVVCAGPLLELWLGAEYAARSTAALAILALGVLTNGLAHLPYAYLLGRGRPDIPAKFHLLELPGYVLVAWLLIQRYGVTGAALAWTLRVSVDAVLLVLGVWRVDRVSPLHFFGARGGRAVAAVVALGAAGMAAYALAPGGELRVALVAVLVAVFGMVAWRVVLDETERMGLRRVLR
jgi:O-antigen/teichoic acid export membrane protein